MEDLVMQDQLQGYYNGKKVFVTGHTGFKGAWLTAALHTLGATVKGYALQPAYENGLFDILKPLKLVESVIGDIRNKKFLEEQILTFQPDFVFHLAAQPLVRRSYEIPAETFEINVTGTANLLESISRLEKKCTVVVVTTDKVYENREENIFYKEDDSLGGYDPYSSSKACTELVVNAFRHSFFNPENYERHKKSIASARAGNVIGGGDWSKDRIIPDIVRALRAGQKIEVRNPKAIRPWQHVLEPITGYLLLAGLLNERPFTFSRAFNFGPLPGDHLTVGELVEIAIGRWGNGEWKDSSSTEAPHEAGLLKLDISRARNELDWEPKLDAKAAISWTVDWYKEPETGQAGFALKQIDEFFKQ
jgi:CDP-glucose 4,6-dehydratase